MTDEQYDGLVACLKARTPGVLVSGPTLAELSTEPQMQQNQPSTPDTNVNPAKPMTRLPDQFDGKRDQKAYIFCLTSRVGNVALYRKWLKTCEHSAQFDCYEVVRIKENKAATKVIAGKEVTFPAHESLPSPEEWGVNGWSFDRASQAEAKFKELVAQAK